MDSSKDIYNTIEFMKLYFIACLLLLLNFFDGFSQNKMAEKEITEVEIEWHSAYKTKDTAILRKVLADDYIHINRLGKQFNKGEEIKALKADDAIYDSIYPYAMQFRFSKGSVVVIGKTKERVCKMEGHLTMTTSGPTYL